MAQEEKQALTMWKSFRWLGSYMKAYWGWLLIGIAAAIGAAVTEVWAGYLTQQLTTEAERGMGPSVTHIVYTMIALVVIGVPAKFFMVYGVERSGALVIRDIRNHLLLHMGRLPLHVLEEQHSGDRISRMSNDVRIIGQFLVRDLGQWFYHPLLFLGCFACLLWMEWRLIVFSALLFPVALLVSQWVGGRLEKTAEEVQANLGQMNASLQDTLGGMPIVKSYLLSGMLIRSYRSLLQLTLQKKLAMHKQAAWITPILFLLTISPILFALVYGSYLISIGHFTIGELVAFLYLLNLAMDPLDQIPSLMTSTFEMSGALKRVREMAQQPPEPENGHPIAVSSVHPPVEFSQVTFGYASGTPILQDLSFTVPAGSTIALVGASGAGKSTVFKLLCGFQPLTDEEQGTIRVFGQSIRHCDLQQLRSHISVVLQESYLFGGTIAENIGYGREGARMEDIVEAAKLAHAHTFIMQLPEGYQTEVGERGGLLSGGQRQRIAIARAFLKGAPILLLDEPTSALDTESEQLVQEALSELMQGRTTMVIAHRLSTIRNADEIWVMEQGRIVERGTHEQLLEQKGVYAQTFYQEFEEEPAPSAAAAAREVVYI